MTVDSALSSNVSSFHHSGIDDIYTKQQTISKQIASPQFYSSPADSASSTPSDAGRLQCSDNQSIDGSDAFEALLALASAARNDDQNDNAKTSNIEDNNNTENIKSHSSTPSTSSSKSSPTQSNRKRKTSDESTEIKQLSKHDIALSKKEDRNRRRREKDAERRAERKYRQQQNRPHISESFIPPITQIKKTDIIDLNSALQTANLLHAPINTTQKQKITKFTPQNYPKQTLTSNQQSQSLSVAPLLTQANIQPIPNFAQHLPTSSVNLQPAQLFQQQQHQPHPTSLSTHQTANNAALSQQLQQWQLLNYTANQLAAQQQIQYAAASAAYVQQQQRMLEEQQHQLQLYQLQQQQQLQQQWQRHQPNHHHNTTQQQQYPTHSFILPSNTSSSLPVQGIQASFPQHNPITYNGISAHTQFQQC